MIDASTVPLWSEAARRRSRARLASDTSCDVAIVGAGYSGLWLAYWLTELRPDLDVIVIERDEVGHGASGRNGGWVSALLPVSLGSLSRTIGDDATRRLQHEMFAAVQEIGEICSRHAIECDYSLGGSVSLVANEEQHRRALADIDDYARFGFADHARLLEPSRTREHLAIDLPSVFRTDCAAVHPRRLVDGLAEIVEARGVRVLERSPVHRIETGRVRSGSADVECRWSVDCREAFGAAQSHRRIVPIHSLMIATEPLSRTQWASIGLDRRQTFTDHRHQLVYGQRTADGRIAFGGRGAGYHFGSRVKPSFDIDDSVHDRLRTALVELFPILDSVRITHRWGGPLAAPRDWTWTVTLDQRSGRGLTGGYVGDGVTSAYVAGRAMAAAIVHGSSDFPLHGHRSPRWEPEPLRWIGINAMARLADVVDRRETRGRKSAILGRVFERLLG